jgi:hypothetical protein
LSPKIRSLTAMPAEPVIQKIWAMRSRLVHQFEAETLTKSAKEFGVPSPLLAKDARMGYPDQI